MSVWNQRRPLSKLGLDQPASLFRLQRLVCVVHSRLHTLSVGCGQRRLAARRCVGARRLLSDAHVWLPKKTHPQDTKGLPPAAARSLRGRRAACVPPQHPSCGREQGAGGRSGSNQRVQISPQTRSMHGHPSALESLHTKTHAESNTCWRCHCCHGCCCGRRRWRVCVCGCVCVCVCSVWRGFQTGVANGMGQGGSGVERCPRPNLCRRPRAPRRARGRAPL